MKRNRILAMAALATLSLAGCKSSTSPPAPASFDARGVVTAVDVFDGQVMINLEDTHGNVAIEPTVFGVADAKFLDDLGAGDRVEGKFRNDAGIRRLTEIKVIARAEIEFFCPMHPRVVRNLEIKCPICWMPLSKRKKDPLAEDAEVEATIRNMAEGDRALVKAQRFCPVLNHVRLAIDGPPVKLSLDGKTFFVCCKACIPMAKAEPAKTLKRFEHLLKFAAEANLPVPADQRIRAVLSKLAVEDRKPAEVQRLCPVTGEALGSMGVPEKVKLGGAEIFLCCPGCKNEATIDPVKTLKTVHDLRAAPAKK